MSQPSGSPTASPEKQALLEAFDTVLKSKADAKEAEQTAAEAHRRARAASRLLALMCATMLLFVSAYLVVERPDWIFPAPLPPESVAIREASLRITVANAVQHIERYRELENRLPATLTDANAYGEGITYDRIGDGYRLTAGSDGVRVIYSAGEPLAHFVGNSFAVISRRGK